MLTESLFREAPAFTQIAFSRLMAWLDDGVPSAGERYVEMRRRFVAYFDRRNCSDPDELADETFNRIARTLEEQGVIRISPPARYCYVVARFVRLEDYRRQRRRAPLDDAAAVDPAWLTGQARGIGPADALFRERRFVCFDRCLGQLKPDQRELVVDYYCDFRRDKIDRRRRIAAGLGITMNALGIRVWRIRQSLTACMERYGFHRMDHRRCGNGETAWRADAEAHRIEVR